MSTITSFLHEFLNSFDAFKSSIHIEVGSRIMGSLILLNKASKFGTE